MKVHIGRIGKYKFHGWESTHIGSIKTIHKYKGERENRLYIHGKTRNEPRIIEMYT